jgi:hypothetical protein
MNNTCTAIAIGSVITALIITTPAQAQPSSLTQLFPALIGVELKSNQRAYLEQLTHQTLPQIKVLLTPSQVQQFDAALKQGQSVREAIFALDLSMSQRFKLTSQLQSVRSKLTTVLTPKQQQQITQNALALQQKKSK